MRETHFLNSTCRHCKYYQPEGRRGGSCSQLGVSVNSNWETCSLAASPFDNALDNLDATLTNLEEIVQLETVFSLSSDFHYQDGLDLKASQNQDEFVSYKTSNR